VRAFIHAGDDKEMATGVRLTGSGGFIELGWEGECRRAAVYADPGFRVPSVADPCEMPAVMGNIIDCLESGAEPELRAERALRAAEVAFAIYESSRRRGRIDLPLTPLDNAFLAMLEGGEIGPSHS
jgi:predicted dehydrogenase